MVLLNSTGMNGTKVFCVFFVALLFYGCKKEVDTEGIFPLQSDDIPHGQYLMTGRRVNGSLSYIQGNKVWDYDTTFYPERTVRVINKNNGRIAWFKQVEWEGVKMNFVEKISNDSTFRYSGLKHDNHMGIYNGATFTYFPKKRIGVISFGWSVYEPGREGFSITTYSGFKK